MGAIQPQKGTLVYLTQEEERYSLSPLDLLRFRLQHPHIWKPTLFRFYVGSIWGQMLRHRLFASCFMSQFHYFTVVCLHESPRLTPDPSTEGRIHHLIVILWMIKTRSMERVLGKYSCLVNIWCGILLPGNCASLGPFRRIGGGMRRPMLNKECECPQSVVH